ncbi:hypothetical protein CU633_05085 [Bacillus sp. V3-13]|uniref:hypothetical protein n=1 Tax=Bacillus sp. V3-13 TaxID=2053728 RepID=UPI000C760F24|nr:hypothetical protein [Bacillus sp. V3-13]PLR78604.1 hypothetical protein CU633_05085 [Bacillus sp. V3-13]
MIKQVLPIILVTLLALVLLGIKIYPSVVNKSASEKNVVVNNNERPVEVSEAEKFVKINESVRFNKTHRDPLKEEQFPFQMKTEEEFAKKYPDQFHIVEKMFYSWDYIQNAQGEFEFGYPLDGEMMHFQFHVDFDKKKNRSQYQIINDGKVIETENVLLKDGIAISQIPEKNIFTKEVITDNERHYLGVYNQEVTNSEWFVLIYNNYPDWHYKEGEQFGMPVYLIEGELTKKTSEFLAGPFSMTVSKETGALLGLKCYGQQNEPVLSLTVKNIEINKGIPDDKFYLDVTGSKELSKKDYGLHLAGMIAEEKPGGVDTSND